MLTMQQTSKWYCSYIYWINMEYKGFYSSCRTISTRRRDSTWWIFTGNQTNVNMYNRWPKIYTDLYRSQHYVTLYASRFLHYVVQIFFKAYSLPLFTRISIVHTRITRWVRYCFTQISCTWIILHHFFYAALLYSVARRFFITKWQ